MAKRKTKPKRKAKPKSKELAKSKAAKPRKRKVGRPVTSKAKWSKFLLVLGNTANVRAAAGAAGVGTRTAYLHRGRYHDAQGRSYPAREGDEGPEGPRRLRR